MKRHSFKIDKPKTSAQELEKLEWEGKLATYGNNIQVESLFANDYITYSLDVEEEDLNMDEFHKFKKSLYSTL